MKQTYEYRYTLRKDRLTGKDGSSYIGYGIEAWKAGERIESVPDIFLQISDTERLIELCNQLQLSPTQLREVVEDRLP